MLTCAQCHIKSVTEEGKVCGTCWLKKWHYCQDPACTNKVRKLLSYCEKHKGSRTYCSLCHDWHEGTCPIQIVFKDD